MGTLFLPSTLGEGRRDVESPPGCSHASSAYKTAIFLRTKEVSIQHSISLSAFVHLCVHSRLNNCYGGSPHAVPFIRNARLWPLIYNDATVYRIEKDLPFVTRLKECPL
ncbi:hypothetical protein TNCV_765701 [Trichonephila clavipes]|nr:hypothetical protein TNCV_765701 [Trichonephila clavipes]